MRTPVSGRGRSSVGTHSYSKHPLDWSIKLNTQPIIYRPSKLPHSAPFIFVKILCLRYYGNLLDTLDEVRAVGKCCSFGICLLIQRQLGDFNHIFQGGSKRLLAASKCVTLHTPARNHEFQVLMVLGHWQQTWTIKGFLHPNYPKLRELPKPSAPKHCLMTLCFWLEGLPVALRPSLSSSQNWPRSNNDTFPLEVIPKQGSVKMFLFFLHALKWDYNIQG